MEWYWSKKSNLQSLISYVLGNFVDCLLHVMKCIFMADILFEDTPVFLERKNFWGLRFK